MTMQCLDEQTALEAYVDGDLNPEQIARLEQHLADCVDCRGELAHLQVAEEALGTWPLLAEPADLTHRVMTRIGSPPETPRFRLRWGDFVVSLAGAGLASVVSLCWLFLFPTSTADSLVRQLHDVLRLRLLPLEMLQLDIQLQIQRFIESGAVMWGMLIVGTVLALALLIALWPLPLRSQKGPIA